MSRYTHEAPMDFEYQNRTGPLDATSPFTQYSQRMNGFSSQTDSPRKRQFDMSSSPNKNRPSSPNKPLPVPPIAAFNGLYSTPRKPSNNDFDDSSAGETPRSPDNKDDSDATPEMRTLRTPASRFDNASRPATATAGQGSPTRDHGRSHRKENLWTSFRKSLNSSGRGEVVRMDYLDKMSRGVEKRRRREVDRNFVRRRRHSMTDSEADSERPRARSPRKVSHGEEAPAPEEKRLHWIAAFFTFIAEKPNLPHILSWYLQLAFNLFFFGCIAWMVYCFYAAVQGDVDKKSYEVAAEIMAEMAACAEQYTANRCDRSTRVPAMETVCENWDRCMKRDPARIGRAKVSAQTFAEIYTSFMEPISFKAVAITVILVGSAFAVTNLAFAFSREKPTGWTGVHPHFGQQQQGPPPPTPQRPFGIQDGSYYTPASSWPQSQIGFEPTPSGGYGQIDGRGSPVRRLAFERE